MFENVIIYDGLFIYAFNFLDKYAIITKKDFEEKILNKNFTITPKYKYNELVVYLEKSLINIIDIINELLLNKNEDNFLQKIITQYYKVIEYNKLENKQSEFEKNLISAFKRLYIKIQFKN
jgi:hypothetical protein